MSTYINNQLLLFIKIFKRRSCTNNFFGMSSFILARISLSLFRYVKSHVYMFTGCIGGGKRDRV